MAYRWPAPQAWVNGEFLQNPAHHAIRVNVQEQLSQGVVRALREGSVSLGVCWDAADLSGRL